MWLRWFTSDAIEPPAVSGDKSSYCEWFIVIYSSLIRGGPFWLEAADAGRFAESGNSQGRWGFHYAVVMQSITSPNIWSVQMIMDSGWLRRIQSHAAGLRCASPTRQAVKAITSRGRSSLTFANQFNQERWSHMLLRGWYLIRCWYNQNYSQSLSRCLYLNNF